MDTLMTTTVRPETARGKRLVAAGYTLIREVSLKFSGKGVWYEVLTPGGSEAVVGYQSAHAIHVFGRGGWTASGRNEATAHRGFLGDVIDTDAQLRGYQKLVRNAPAGLVCTYDGLYYA